MVLTETDLEDVKNYVLQELPRVLDKDPQFVTLVERIINEKFPRRDEFARMLDELTNLRLKSEEAAADRQAIRQEASAEREAIRKEAAADRQAIRQEASAEREAIRQEAAADRQAIRDEMRQGFEEAAAERRLIRQDLLKVKRDVTQLKSGQQDIIKRLDGQEAWLRMMQGQMGNEKGHNMETIFAAGLRYALKIDVTVDQIRLRQILIDHEGIIYPEKGFETEIDIIVQNGKLLAFEVKATIRWRDVGTFFQKVRLLTLQNPDKEVRGVMITFSSDDKIIEQCERYNIELINGISYDDESSSED